MKEINENQKNSLLAYAKLLKKNKINVDTSNYLFLKDNYKKIYKLIDEDPKLSYNSKKTYLNNLGVMLRNLLHLKEDIIKKIIDRAMYYGEKDRDYIEMLDSNETSDKCFIPYDELLAKLEEMKENYKKSPTRKNTILLLIIMLNVLQPPLRRNLVDMEIITNSNFAEKDKNYLLVKKGSYSYIINSDKVSNSKTSEQEKNIPVQKEIGDFIVETLFRFPRNYLLSSLYGNSPMTIKGYNYALKLLFPKIDCMSQNVFRRSFITHIISNHPTKKILRNLALSMRTSLDQIFLVYNQNIPTGSRALIPLNMEEKNKWTRLYRQNNKDMFKKQYDRYYKDNRQEILRKRLLSLLNRGKTKEPREKTIEKYNLKFDGGKWY